MRRSILAIACLIVWLVFQPSLSFAWNARGHMLIARLTYLQLTGSERKQSADILRKHPFYEQELLRNLASGVDADEWAFLIAATWPDIARGELYRDKFNQGPFHYVNRPFTRGEDGSLIDLPFDPVIPNVVTAIGDSLRMIKDPNLLDPARPDGDPLPISVPVSVRESVLV